MSPLSTWDTEDLPLGWRTVHDDIDPQDLHGIERVG